MASALSPADRQIVLTEREVADMFRVAPRTVRRWASKGCLPRIQIGGVTRYRAADVELILNAKNPAGEPGSSEIAVRAATDAGSA